MKILRGHTVVWLHQIWNPYASSNIVVPGTWVQTGLAACRGSVSIYAFSFSETGKISSNLLEKRNKLQKRHVDCFINHPVTPEVWLLISVSALCPDLTPAFSQYMVTSSTFMVLKQNNLGGWGHFVRSQGIYSFHLSALEVTANIWPAAIGDWCEETFPVSVGEK